MAEQHRAPPATPEARWERQDVTPRGMAIAVTAVLLGLLAALLVAAAVWQRGTGETAPEQSSWPPAAVPAPHLQLDPRGELAALRRRQQTRLESRGWIDRDAGIVHIPIEQAMALIVERGLPQWRPSSTPTPAMTAQQARQRVRSRHSESGQNRETQP